MASRWELLVSFALFVFFCSSLARADTLKITSIPSGASVEINGVTVGTTPYEEEVPGGYFHKTKTALGRRLQHSMIAPISLAGYTTKEVQMTEGPMNWVSLKGHNHGEYWLVKLKHFHVELDPISKVFAGNISADIPEPAEAPGRLDLNAQPGLEDVIARAKPAVVRLRTEQIGQWLLRYGKGRHRHQRASRPRRRFLAGHSFRWRATHRQNHSH